MGSPQRRTSTNPPARSEQGGGEGNRVEPPEELVVVGIGASAGGLEALSQFVGKLPRKANMAYVVAQHMSPHHRSMMVDLLSRETDLPVREVKHDLNPKADTIYVAPPNSDVSIKDGKLQLRRPLTELGAKPSIDYLFVSMAEDLGDRTIGVVLSGTGSDGAIGIRAINSAGGISIAQQPRTAKYDSMPLAAIKAGVDLVLPPDEIAKQLLQTTARPRLALAENDATAASTPIDQLIALIHRETRMDFSAYKETTIARQIERRMAVVQVNQLEDYVALAEKNRAELNALAGNFLVCVTSFFRDADAFAALQVELREFLTKKRPGEEIRIWVPGCATGEEAYTIAIIVAEELGDALERYKVQIFATDANPESTQAGRRGLYAETSIDGVDPTILAKYFVQQDRFFQVDRRIRDMVVFATHDLAQDPPFVRLDVISCRNLLIYFKTPLQDKALRIFHYALRSDGLLLLGKSESVGHNTNLFADVDRRLKIFRRTNISLPRPGSAFGRPAPIAAGTPAPATGATEKVATPSERGRKALFNAYAPPSALISPEGTIVELFGEISTFIRLRPGKPDFSVFSLVHQPLRTELRALVQKVTRSRETCHTRPFTLEVEGSEAAFRATIRLVDTASARDELLLISFEALPSEDATSVELESFDATNDIRLAELQHELTITRESLQTVIEELETSNEELQSLNEETEAGNEELQASNEELETSNEELQATNEELTTVNDELSMKTLQLAEALSDMENIQDSIGAAFLLVDDDLVVRRYNQAVLEYLKLDPASSEQNLRAIPSYVGIDDLYGKIQTVSATGQRHSEIFTFRERTCKLGISPYRSEQTRQQRGAVVVFFDVTALEQARMKAQQATEAKSDFIRQMSHELRTPLNGIIGFAQLLERTPEAAPDQQHRSWLRHILDGGQHILALINDTADLATVEAGRVELDLAVIDPKPVVEEAIALTRDMAEQRAISIHVRETDRDLGCEALRIVADRRRLKQVLLNLLSNAIKYNRDGGSVTIECVDLEDRARLVVSDTGYGIPDQARERVFEPFNRLHPEDLKAEGSGLGLAISRQLAELMGGTLQLESREDQGTQFWVEFPRIDSIPAGSSESVVAQ